MPVQTTERSFMRVPDGTKISVKAYGEIIMLYINFESNDENEDWVEILRRNEDE